MLSPSLRGSWAFPQLPPSAVEGSVVAYLPRLSLDRLPSGGEDVKSDRELELSPGRIFPRSKPFSAIANWANTKEKESPQHKERECIAFEKKKMLSQNKSRCKKPCFRFLLFPSLFVKEYKLYGNNDPSYTLSPEDPWLRGRLDNSSMFHSLLKSPNIY